MNPANRDPESDESSLSDTDFPDPEEDETTQVTSVDATIAGRKEKRINVID